MSLSDEEQACAISGNLYPFCSPISSDVWVNGTIHDFVWNFNYPFYVGYPTINLYLYYFISYEYVTVKNYTNLDRSAGGFQATVDDTWFLQKAQPGASNNNLTIYGFYLPPDASPYVEIASSTSMYPRPFNFTVTQIAPPANSSTNSNSTTMGSNNSTTGNSSNNNNASESSSSSSTLPGWAIAVTVIAVVALVCGAAALIWAIINAHKNKKQNSKSMPAAGTGAAVAAAYAGGNNNNNHDKNAGDPTSSSRHLILGEKDDIRSSRVRSTDSIPATTLSMGAENASSVGTLASKGTPVNAALGWSSSHHSDWNKPDNEEDEELKRKKVGDTLLQRQLEEDGTQVKHTERFTRVKSLADIPKSAIFEQSNH